MSHNKRVTESNVIGGLGHRPESQTAIGNYLESKRDLIDFAKRPNWDTPADSVEYLYLQNQFERDSLQTQREEMQTKAKNQADINASRIENMFKIHGKLRKRLYDLNNFIRECDEKKTAAQRKIDEQKQIQVGVRAKIDKDSRQLKQLSKFHKLLKKEADKYAPYETILVEAVEKSNGRFHTIKDCIDCCDGLMLAQDEMLSMRSQKQQEVDEIRSRMVKIAKAAAQAVMGLKTDLNYLSRAYSQARTECNEWEKTLHNAKDTINLHDLDKDRALEAINFLYRILCRRCEMEPVFLRHELNEQLDFIKEEVEVLRGVVKVFDKKASKTQKPSPEAAETDADIFC